MLVKADIEDNWSHIERRDGLNFWDRADKQFIVAISRTPLSIAHVDLG